ncbi:MAG: hypothetical protein ABL934_15670 [Lysobacteraceae bacterium]
MRRHPEETSLNTHLRIATAIGIALLTGVLVPVSIGIGLAQNPKVAVQAPKAPDGEGAEQQRQRILKEIARLPNHPWAGEYYEGDGLGANIRISLAPDAGVAATWHGCMGLYGANRGKVVVGRDGELRFEYRTPNAQGFAGFPDAMLPVRWGQRRYMIPDNKRMAFVNAINHGQEPRGQIHGMFLLGQDDEKKMVEGLPDLPPAYLALIRRAPMQTRVVSIDGVDKKKSDHGCSFTYRMTLDRGAKDRFAPGIELKPVGQPRTWETATIETVAGDTATAKMAVWYDDCTHPKTVPVAGWIFTTGGYDGKSGVVR